MWQKTSAACWSRLRRPAPSNVHRVTDDLDAPGPVAENAAVAAAVSKLEELTSAPLDQHAAIFEDVRSELRRALDAD